MVAQDPRPGRSRAFAATKAREASARELAETVGRGVDATFGRASENNFNDLDAWLRRRGVTMDFSKVGDDMTFSRRGVTVSGTDAGASLDALKVRSAEVNRRLARAMTPDDLHAMTEAVRADDARRDGVGQDASRSATARPAHAVAEAQRARSVEVDLFDDTCRHNGTRW